jgi:hypothetical protein
VGRGGKESAYFLSSKAPSAGSKWLAPALPLEAALGGG